MKVNKCFVLMAAVTGLACYRQYDVVIRHGTIYDGSGSAPFVGDVVIDADAETSLSSEHLLNADGLLEIHKVYDCSVKKPKLTRTFAWALH